MQEICLLTFEIREFTSFERLILNMYPRALARR